jgi:hypothetical protein
MDLSLARKVWNPAVRTTCLDCGEFIVRLERDCIVWVKKRAVYGWGIQCPACLLKRVEGPPTPLDRWPAHVKQASG